MDQDPEPSDKARRLDDKYIDLIRAEIERIDKFIRSERLVFRALATITGVIILGLGAAAAFLIGSTFNEVARQVERTATIEVAREIGEWKSRNADLRSLREAFEREHKETLNRWEQLAETARILAERERDLPPDAYGAYLALAGLEDRSRSPAGLTIDEREQGMAHAKLVIEAGMRGAADPNLLFNAGVRAGRLQYARESVELATLAHHWHPTLSHKAFVLEVQDQFGLAFSIADGRLRLLDRTAEEVRAETWQEFLALIATKPRAGAHQLYSRASNVAVRNRDQGFQAALVSAILRSAESGGAEPVAFGWATAANSVAFEGAPGWEREYERLIVRAVAQLATESPLSQWSGSALRSMSRTAERLNKTEFLMAQLATHGFDPARVRLFLTSTSD